MQKNKIIGLSLLPSGSELVSAADFKAFAKITYTDEDAIITGLITSARQTIEKEAGISLMNYIVTLTVDNADTSMPLPYGPATITSVSRMDSEYVYTALDIDYYSLDGSLLLRSDNGRHKIVYTTVQMTDQALKDAIKMRALSMYEHRGDDINDSQNIQSHPKWIESNLIVDRYRNFNWL